MLTACSIRAMFTANVRELRQSRTKKRTAKGEVYERNIFTNKDSRFKSDCFLDEVKRSYTDLINIYVKDEKS